MRNSFTVKVPASTSNLGAGFDCFGLALQLYLTIRATVMPLGATACQVRSVGANAGLPRGTDNLIYGVMSHVARSEGRTLPPVRLAVHNEIPLGGGLGSSAAAIVAGVKLAGAVCGQSLSEAAVLRYAAEMEGHPDNAAASVRGGFVVNAVATDGAVVSVRQDWPADLKVIVVSPHAFLATHEARAALPQTVSRADAVFNLQRAALFSAALATRSYDVLREAMRDALHQNYRRFLLPGLAEALDLKPQPGLCGVALSGAGPAVLALATENFTALGQSIADCFARQGQEVSVRLLEVANIGAQMRGK